MWHVPENIRGRCHQLWGNMQHHTKYEKIRLIFEFYLWIKTNYGQTNKSLNWIFFSNFFHKNNNIKILHDISFSENDHHCNARATTSFISWIQWHFRPFYRVRVFFTDSIKIIIIISIKTIATCIQRNFFLQEVF